MSEPPPPPAEGRALKGFGEFAGVWDLAFVCSPNLRETQTSARDDYQCTYSGDGGIEIKAHVKGFKAMIAARKYETVTGGQRAFTEHPTNLKASREVVIYVSKEWKITGKRPLRSL
jgi:hypothetical protein